jgi:hypothetical protein
MYRILDSNKSTNNFLKGSFQFCLPRFEDRGVDFLDECKIRRILIFVPLTPMSMLTLKQDLHGLPVSINDIRDKYFEDIPLTDEERRALTNYDKYRMDYLNAAPTEEIFEARYLELQAKANLASYTEFLNAENLKFD